ncbi:hypothetical protein PILCRDRAFT_814158 [Piloderma croceum F 1598]|uniref:Microbial-type PARG catalytic domain-containing protein n=1 Tax=Piloderma croceum (strain F 1598) TaxID=765440 RepID=A0A0C3GC81_PILCF|nr:hypothetical protein PILCRDRAFT_814158 [Piloderma croceum F 1598]
MAPSFVERHKIAKDTIARSASVAAETPGASLESNFISEQLPALRDLQCPGFTDIDLKIVNLDSFSAARNILENHKDAQGKVAVLNLASDAERAGGWIYSLSMTQEEALCYSSTLYNTLKPSYYPWPNLGPGSVAGVFSPSVVIFKDDLDNGCKDLTKDKFAIVSVITVAAPRWPDLSADRLSFKHASDLEDLRGKIRLVYRMAAWNGKTSIVLGAMGCGAYRCPPRLVAEEMKSVLMEEEFDKWFQHIVFAIYSTRGNGEGNFEIFNDVFDGVYRRR